MAYNCTDECRAKMRKVEELDAVRQMRKVVELEAVRQEGYKMFADGDWTGAIGRYSHCINLAGCQADIELEKARDDAFDYVERSGFNRVLALAYSNRAEARLQLQDYKEALVDADRALHSDPYQQRVKSLVLKGKAAHGLECYAKACEAYTSALTEPLAVLERLEVLEIVKLLEESTTADKQSRTGLYDLMGYFCRGCTGEVRCADFVGPVEIRRLPGGDGQQRGLLATKSLEPGELLLVSNPLAVRRQEMTPVSEDQGLEEGFELLRNEFPEDLLLELVRRIKKSSVQLARFGYLIPPMRLYRPGTEPNLLHPRNKVVSVQKVRQIARKKLFHYVQGNSQSAIFRYADSTEVVGLWIRPAFANHSCAPSCQHSFVGHTMFFRASRYISSGEELTITHNSSSYEQVTFREKSLRNWMFTCKCERCLFEEKLAPQLSKISQAAAGIVQRRHEYAFKELGTAAEEILDTEAELANAADEVEAVVQSLGTTALLRQPAWIRTSFVRLYSAKLKCHDDYVENLKLAVNSLSSVYLTPTVLRQAARLLVIVHKRYSGNSHAYRDTLDEVRDIYRVYFGRHPDEDLHNLIQVEARGLEM